jgi:hypothetical protein
MPRYSDNSNIPNTCPKIDEVISAIESVDWGDSSYWDKRILIEILEKIRKANSDLRDWGNQMCRERDDLEDQLDELRKENQSLKDEASYLEKVIKESLE